MITQKDMRTCSKQEIFDFVYVHLMEQKRQASFGERCFLRIKFPKDLEIQPQVLACAVGCLIPDEHLKPEMDYNLSFKANDALLEYFPDTLHNLLVDLQCIHDGYSACDWGVKLRSYAEEHGFTLPNVSQNG